jgi:DNA mismatch repair ATPase MutL
VANNRKKNSIYTLEINHRTIYDSQIIKQYIHKYYKDLLGQSNTRIVTLNQILWHVGDILT